MQAFMKAWIAACQAQPYRRSIIVIPAKKTYLLKPITFNGPCKPAQIFVQVIYLYLTATGCVDLPILFFSIFIFFLRMTNVLIRILQ